ncbi:MAG: hypothetical protein ABI091_26755 [Ferruginibacter sp.]
MVDPYHDIVSYSGDERIFDEYLKKRHLFDLFKDLLDEFPDVNIFFGIVKYILYAFTPSSDMLLMNGETFEKTSERIFKKAKLPQSVYGEVALMKSEAVQGAIDRWLQFGNEEEFTNYVNFRSLRREMLSSSVGSILKSTGEQDFEQKMKNAHHAKELLEMMKEALAKYVQNSPKLKNSIKAYDSIILNKNTATVEDFINKSR